MMEMKAKKIYVPPKSETIDMDVCLLGSWSVNKGGDDGGTVDEGDQLAPQMMYDMDIPSDSDY